MSLDLSPTAASSTIDASLRQLRIASVLPPGTLHGSTVTLAAAVLPSVGPVAIASGGAAHTVLLTRGIAAPAVYPAVGSDPNWITPCVSSEGVIYIPEFGYCGKDPRRGEQAMPSYLGRPIDH